MLIGDAYELISTMVLAGRWVVRQSWHNAFGEWYATAAGMHHFGACCMRYGFAIDQRTCIGCHACTVACKTEHEMPLGQFRTWVKYVDKGTFPATTREFGVLRCNHCTD